MRELKNTIERIVVTCPDREVRAEQLPSRVRQAVSAAESFSIELGMSLEGVERALIEKTLTHVTRNRKEAASILGISVRALQYKIKKYHL